MFPGGTVYPKEWDGVKTSRASWSTSPGNAGAEALLHCTMAYLGPLARGAQLLMLHCQELPASCTMRDALHYAGFSLHDEDGFWHI
jgi:hypothetical protein